MNSIHGVLLVTAAILTVLVSGCGDPPGTTRNSELSADETSGVLVLTGSSTMAPLMKAIAERYQQLHPKVTIKISTGGSGSGISDARSGAAQIAMASRDLNDTEGDLFTFALAGDGICLLVNKDNPILGLSKQQVRAIYMGEITNWKEVGGNDATIRVLTRTPGRAEIEVISNYLGIREEQIKAADAVGDNPIGIAATAANPQAIVYLSVGESERESRKGVAVKLLQSDGVSPTSGTVRSGEFPISRSLILVTRDVPLGLSKQFITFALSPKNTDLIVQFGFVPILN